MARPRAAILFSALLLLLAATPALSAGAGTIVFTTLGGSRYAFDIFALPLNRLALRGLDRRRVARRRRVGRGGAGPPHRRLRLPHPRRVPAHAARGGRKVAVLGRRVHALLPPPRRRRLVRRVPRQDRDLRRALGGVRGADHPAGVPRLHARRVARRAGARGGGHQAARLRLPPHRGDRPDLRRRRERRPLGGHQARGAARAPLQHLRLAGRRGSGTTAAGAAGTGTRRCCSRASGARNRTRSRCSGSTGPTLPSRPMARRLTDGPWSDTMCNWSPDGEWIAFASDRYNPGGVSFAIYMVHPNGTWLRRVVHSADGGRTNHPWLSPDSKSLVFTSDLAAVSAEPISNPHHYQPYGEIFTINSDGSGLRRLTHNSFEDGTPSWTPHFLQPRDVDETLQASGRCAFQDCHWLDIDGQTEDDGLRFAHGNNKIVC